MRVYEGRAHRAHQVSAHLCVCVCGLILYACWAAFRTCSCVCVESSYRFVRCPKIFVIVVLSVNFDLHLIRLPNGVRTHEMALNEQGLMYSRLSSEVYDWIGPLGSLEANSPAFANCASKSAAKSPKLLAPASCCCCCCCENRAARMGTKSWLYAEGPSLALPSSCQLPVAAMLLLLLLLLALSEA